MSELPGDLKYTKDHEWARVEDDGTVKIGITDHAQTALGDLVYIEPPEIGSTVAAGDSCAVVESVKAASDVYSPIGGEITAANELLADAPETVNQDPYGDGWLFAVRPDDNAELDALMDADAYQALLDEEG
ncbi:MAG: glycine cleavage system protein GcvH [Chromatiales bacterium]|jgi:glycine cleavage system H protein|nr:glycine cleavage system protein GcvH [Chromatiales bacterium]MDH4012655.1 glycine cleavage system protein GcvH [Chromatiales bacterium]PLX55345.1 MAG: glycine cleavage system protein H [Chromatiales bacterium]